MAKRDAQVVRQLGERLRKLREARNLTQEQVAARAGFTAKYVSEIERALRDLPLSTVRAVVEDGLGETLASVFSEFDGPDAETKSPAAVPRLPRALHETALRIASLPPEARRHVMAVLREVLALSSQGATPP